MLRKTLSILMLSILSLSAAVTVSPVVGAEADKPAAAMRNAKLRNIPVNTWIRLCDFQMDRGAAEVRWCYDSHHRRFVRVGGCTSSYSNEVYSFDLGTEKWTQNLPYTKASGEKKRPGHGCNRGIAYDPDHKCIWTFGGASSYHPPGNTLGFWQGVGKLGDEDWRYMEGVPHLDQGAVAYDATARKERRIDDVGLRPGAQRPRARQVPRITQRVGLGVPLQVVLLAPPMAKPTSCPPAVVGDRFLIILR